MTSILTSEETQQIARHAKASDDTQQVVKLAEALLEIAVAKGASDAHIEPFEETVVVRFRVDGVLHDITEMPHATYDRLLARIKVLTNLKIDEHRKPQDGRFKGKFGDAFVDFRVSVMPMLFGEKVALRILPQEVRSRPLTDLGFDEQATSVILHHVRKLYGMILVCGPTSVGKSTTLHTLLQSLLAERGVSANVNTIEDPVEYAMPRVNQVQAGITGGIAFSAALRGLLRQDADVIMVGEIRDEETARAAIEASLTGRLLLSSLHTRDAVGAVIRLLEIGIEPYLVASVTSLIIAQRLVRMLCLKCVESYQPNAATYRELAEQYGLDRVLADIEKRFPSLAPIAKPPTLYRGRGCEACAQSGYSGRTAVFEVLEVTDALRTLVQQHASAQNLREQAMTEGMVTMFQDGFAKALSGRTSLEEVLKATLE